MFCVQKIYRQHVQIPRVHVQKVHCQHAQDSRLPIEVSSDFFHSTFAAVVEGKYRLSDSFIVKVHTS